MIGLQTNIFINLSPRQFADGWLAEKVLHSLTENTFPAHRLEFEITETTFIDRIDEAKATLQSLRNLGVQIALDLPAHPAPEPILQLV